MEKEKEITEGFLRKNKNALGYIDYSNIQQPEMRFKPRTDLERIIDSINKQNYSKMNVDLLQMQLKSLSLNVPKVKESKNVLIQEYGQDSNRINFLKKLEENNNKAKVDYVITEDDLSTLSHKEKRKRIDNKEARNLLPDLHNRTHFKAAAMFTVDKSYILNRINQKQESESQTTASE